MLLLLLDHDSYLPTYACISNAKKYDPPVARKVSLAPGSIVDLYHGYNDYKLSSHWTENKIYFSARLKTNADHIVSEYLKVPENRNIPADQPIFLIEGTKFTALCS